MINAQMKEYDLFTFGEVDAYGQPTLSEKRGTVRMAINIASQRVQEGIHYSNCSYVGLTHSLLDDTCVIQYGDEKLKVLYVNPLGRFTQVFLGTM